MVTSDGLVQSVVVTDVSGREVYYANGLLVNSPIVIPGNVFCVPGLYGIALNNFTGSVRTLLPVVP